MSHQKPQVSVPDPHQVYLQFDNNHNGRNHKPRQKPQKSPASESHSRSTDKRCHSTPAKKLQHKPQRKASRSTHERQIITQKLREIDELRSKILELQWALSSHEDMCAVTLAEKKSKSSNCFRCLKRCNRNVDSEIFFQNRDCSKMTLDQMSTEVVFNSSRESLPYIPTVDKPKRYRKRRKVKKQPEVKGSRRKETSKDNVQKRKQGKTSDNNTIVLPSTSTKNTSEEMMHLAERLDAQNNDIKEIKSSLQECLELLRQKNAREEEENATINEELPPSSRSMRDSFLYGITPSIITNYLRESHVLNFFSPNRPQVFTCDSERHCEEPECKSREPRTQLTVRKASMASNYRKHKIRQRKKQQQQQKKKCSTCGNTRSSITCETCCSTCGSTCYSTCGGTSTCCPPSKCCRPSKCCKRRKRCRRSTCCPPSKCCRPSKCRPSKCCGPSTCQSPPSCCQPSVCCYPRRPQLVLVKCTGADASTPCTSSHTRNAGTCQGREVVRKSSSYRRRMEDNSSSCCRPTGKTTATSPVVEYEDPEPYVSPQPSIAVRRTRTDAESRPRRRRRSKSNDQARGRSPERYVTGTGTGTGTGSSIGCACPKDQQRGPTRRKNGFLRCLLCMFCRHACDM